MDDTLAFDSPEKSGSSNAALVVVIVMVVLVGGFFVGNIALYL